MSWYLPCKTIGIEGSLAVLKQSFYWFLLACELAAIVLLILGIMGKLKQIFQRQLAEISGS